jgi:hypothetical protein
MAEPFGDQGGGDPAQAVAVYRDPSTADAARLDLIRVGIPGEDIRVGADGVASARAAMRAEVETSMIAPFAGIAWTKESTKSFVVLAPALAVAGIVVMLPVTAWAASGWGVGPRVLLAVPVGAALGLAVALIVAALGARGPAQPVGSERGVTVRVVSADPRVLEVLRTLHPVRLDVVRADGTPMGFTVSEEDDHPIATLEDRVLHQTDPDWEDSAVQDGGGDQASGEPMSGGRSTPD